MAIPDILALDFDGVLCDGMREYFETSRHTYRRVWPREPAPADDSLAAFRRLRPVILSGWEMPLLLRAIVRGVPEGDVLRDWEKVCEDLAREAGRPDRDGLVHLLGTTLDQVRRESIAADRAAWAALNEPYESLDDLRRLVAEPPQALVVTTKDGEFSRGVVDNGKEKIADVQGKEARIHECENLRALIKAHESAKGCRPTIWFVEDRLETLEHVTTHEDLSDVGLYLATWGYNTEEARARTKENPRIHLLKLEEFKGGLQSWPQRQAE